jgi:DNA-binding LacI/PurR family transcriptional regulator
MSVRHIARLAHLSPAAVSMALLNSPKISAATRQRVQEIADQIGYRPNVKVAELMSHVRMSRGPKDEGCFGLVSLYDSARPWEQSRHLQRIYEGMRTRASAMGYRLEPLWLRAPDMTPRRFREILDARGIEGLLCFGGPLIDAALPSELDHYAIVTLGMSIRTPLHRVITHEFSDTWQTLDRLRAAGYRRPGIVLGQHEDERGRHTRPSAYLGWCDYVLGSHEAIPVLRLERAAEAPLVDWLARYRPDVMVIADHYDALREFTAILASNHIRVPEDLGVAAISQILEGTGLSGMQENQDLMGAWAVELLLARIMNQDLGMPGHPRIEMVESQWIEGESLRKLPAG